MYRAFHNVLHDYKHLQQENQRTYLNGIVHSHRKTEKFFFTTRNVQCVHHGWHGTHRYDIQVLATHASTWVHRPLDFCLHTHPVSVNCLYHAGMVSSVGVSFCVLCTKYTLHSNHRLTRVMFQHTKRLLPRSGHFFHYKHSHRLAAEMWTTMKKTTYWWGGKKIELFLLSVQVS
jgi:hypothetical protein